ncbi:MAG: phenol hydroxylase [Alcaligenaceae bacterium]|nr:phenol hydroxylase [Alcaligenaceae bacterium]
MSCINPVTDLAPASHEDLSRRSVHILSRRDNGYIEFEFSIGWPELALELVLSEKDFQQFCKTHAVVLLGNQT